jgi:hypothetical protein
MVSRNDHLVRDLVKSKYTTDLFIQYKKHLGLFRYKILIEAQKLVVPGHVSELLGFVAVSFFRPLVGVYKVARRMKMDWFLISAILPRQYKKQVRDLNNPT